MRQKKDSVLARDRMATHKTTGRPQAARLCC
jgi:hypothetical protein